MQINLYSCKIFLRNFYRTTDVCSLEFERLQRDTQELYERTIDLSEKSISNVIRYIIRQSDVDSSARFSYSVNIRGTQIRDCLVINQDQDYISKRQSRL